MNESCATSEIVAAWISGRLPQHDVHALEAHADRCELCLHVLAAVGKICADPHSRKLQHSHGAPVLADWALLVAAPTATPPAAVSRYTLRGVLGRGGFGIVYDAVDRELDRPVAIKALAAGHGDDALRAEAQALATLSHPNVVAVYDVVETHGRVYLVMEHVTGRTLREWQGQRPRHEVIAGYLAAAAGLIAIHDAGLVHADIKPDNVLVADDGRVLVTDFGLSRGGVADRARVGAALGVAGTPRYMAPEQARGEAIGATADQYSFCLALYEAIHGALPGQTSPRTSPRTLRAVLQRGLSQDPARRYPNMTSLVAALRTATKPRPQVWPVAIALALVTGIATWADATPPIVDSIADAPAIESVASQTSEVSPAIDRAVAQRNAGDLDGSLATLAPIIRGELGGSLLLQTRARHEFGRTLGARHDLASRQMFIDAHEAALAQRADLLAAMISIDLADSEAETPATLMTARMWLGTAKAELRRVDIDPSRHGNLVAAAAQIAAIEGDEAQAALGFERASSLLADMDPVARARAHTRWASMLGRLGEHQRALTKVDEAHAMCELAGLATSVERIELRRVAATILEHLGRFDEAIAEIELALTMAASISGYSRAALAHLHGDLGVFHLENNHRDQADQHLKLALELAPDSWVAHNNLSIHYAKLGCNTDSVTTGCDPEAADRGYAHQLRSVELARETFGESHPTFATMRANLARDLLDRGEVDRALDLYVLSCDQLAVHFGDDARQLMNPLFGLVEANVRLGRREQAADAARRLRVVAHGPAFTGRDDTIAVLDYVIGRALSWSAPADRQAAALAAAGRRFFGDAAPDDFQVIDAWFS